jgi:hypothetical protein
MSDDEKEPKVIQMEDFRNRAGSRAYEAGEAFAFLQVEEPDACVGTTDDEVVAIWDDSLRGVAFSPEGARKLAIALIEAANFIDLQHKGLVTLD